MSSRQLWAIGALLAVAGLPAASLAQFTPIAQPDVSYLGATTVLPITAVDFATDTSLTNGTVTASFDISLVALTVPTTWSTWAAPPNVENATPRVMWTNGFTSLTLTLAPAVTLFGLEAQPNTSTPSSITATFFNGMTTLGSIMLNVDGNAGARLFAASSTTPIDRVVLSATDDFAVAQLRAGSIPVSPTPTQTSTRTPTNTGSPTPTNTPGGAGSSCTSQGQCGSGLFCADGVCCTSPCTGRDQACNVPPNVGTCSPFVVPAPALSPIALMLGLATLVAVAALGLLRRAGRRS